MQDFIAVEGSTHFTRNVLAYNFQELTNVISIILFYTVTVTWNGTTITDPVLIYQDEIISDNRDNVETDPPLPGTLICRHEIKHRLKLVGTLQMHKPYQQSQIFTSDREEQGQQQLLVCLG